MSVLNDIDELNRMLHAAEERFDQYCAPAAIELTEQWMLCWNKRSASGWALYGHDQETGQYVPLRSAPRAIRILAAHRLVELKEKLDDASAITDDSVRSAVEAARRFVMAKAPHDGDEDR